MIVTRKADYRKDPRPWSQKVKQEQKQTPVWKTLSEKVKKEVRGLGLSLTHGTEHTGRRSHPQVEHGQADVHPDHAVAGDIQTDSR